MEDFAISILTDKREALDEDLPLTRRAEIAELPLPIFARIIASPQFRNLLRMDLVNNVFTIGAEQEHIHQVARVAQNHQKTVVSASGKVVQVDQAAGDIINAGKYLNELRGTPIEKRAESAPSVVINIGGTQLGEEDAPTIDVDVESYRPQRAGSLPPPGVQARARNPVQQRTLPPTHDDEELGSLYGPNAEDEDEDRAIAEKQEPRETAAGRIDFEETRNPGRGTPSRRKFVKKRVRKV